MQASQGGMICVRIHVVDTNRSYDTATVLNHVVEPRQSLHTFQDFIAAWLVQVGYDNRPFKLYLGYHYPREIVVESAVRATVGQVFREEKTVQVQLQSSSSRTSDPNTLHWRSRSPGNSTDSGTRYGDLLGSTIDLCGANSVTGKYIVSPCASRDEERRSSREHSRLGDNPVNAVHCRGTISQFDMPGGTSSCTSVCLIAACWMLESGGAVDLTGDMLDSLVQQGVSVYQQSRHADLDDLWDNPSFHTSEIDRGVSMQKTISRANFASSLEAALQFSREANEERVAVILTKPPETVLCFANSSDDWYLIDSHGEQHERKKRAYAMRFRSLDLLANALLDKFPPFSSSDDVLDEGWQMQSINMFEATPLIRREKSSSKAECNHLENKGLDKSSDKLATDTLGRVKLTTPSTRQVGSHRGSSRYAIDDGELEDNNQELQGLCQEETATSHPSPADMLTKHRHYDVVDDYHENETSNAYRCSVSGYEENVPSALATECERLNQKIPLTEGICIQHDLGIHVDLCGYKVGVERSKMMPSTRCSVSCCVAPLVEGLDCPRCGRIVCRDCLRFAVNDNKTTICLECASHCIQEVGNTRTSHESIQKYIIPRIEEIYQRSKALLKHETDMIAEKKYGPSIQRLRDRIDSLQEKVSSEFLDDGYSYDNDSDLVMHVPLDPSGDRYVCNVNGGTQMLHVDSDRQASITLGSNTKQNFRLVNLLIEVKDEIDRVPLSRRLATSDSSKSELISALKEVRSVLHGFEPEDGNLLQGKSADRYEAWQDAVISIQHRIAYPEPLLAGETKLMLERLRSCRESLQSNSDAIFIGKRDHWAETLGALQAEASERFHHKTKDP